MRIRDYDVECPRCGRRASWEEAFESVPARAGRPVPDDDPRPVHEWSGVFIRERFPSVAPWRPPAGRTSPYRLHGESGVIRCTACHHVSASPLCWPASAYFRWRLRGQLLWAWNAGHARVLLHYVRSAVRDPRMYAGEYPAALEKTPAPFLAARNRAAVGRLISARLEGAAISSTLPDAALRHPRRGTGPQPSGGDHE